MIYVLSPNKKMIIYESNSQENIKEISNNLLKSFDIPIDFSDCVISNIKPNKCENLLEYKYIGNLLLDMSVTGGEGYSSKYFLSKKKKLKKKKGLYKPFTEIISEDKENNEKECLCDLYKSFLLNNKFSIQGNENTKSFHKKYTNNRTINIYFSDKIQMTVTNDSGKQIFFHEYKPTDDFEKAKTFLATKIKQLIRAADIR